MISPDEFLYFVKDEAPERQTRLAKVDPDYTSGRPRLVFDGETQVSGKPYPYLSSYTPAANDRVLLARAGSSWVVVGSIE